MYGIRIKGESPELPRDPHARRFLLGDPIDYADEVYTWRGCSYQDYESILLNGIFGFCGCGDSFGVIKYIASALRYNVEERALSKALRTAHPNDRNAWEEYCIGANAREEEVFGSKGGATFAYYVLTKAELMEHGGSVPGWLTREGEEYLEVLEEYITRIEPKPDFGLIIEGGFYPAQNSGAIPLAAPTEKETDLQRVEAVMRKFGYSPYGNMFTVYGEYGHFEYRKVTGPQPKDDHGKIVGPNPTEHGGTWDSNKESADEFITRMEAQHGSKH